VVLVTYLRVVCPPCTALAAAANTLRVGVAVVVVVVTT
jgi:hypothetical protein